MAVRVYVRVHKEQKYDVDMECKFAVGIIKQA